MIADLFPAIAIGSTLLLVLAAVGVMIMLYCAGRQHGRKERQRWAFVQGWRQGRAAERKDRELWEQLGGAEAFYPQIVEKLPNGSHRVCTPRRPRP